MIQKAGREFVARYNGKCELCRRVIKQHEDVIYAVIVGDSTRFAHQRCMDIEVRDSVSQLREGT
jgi:hypothetical protein